MTFHGPALLALADFQMHVIRPRMTTLEKC